MGAALNAAGAAANIVDSDYVIGARREASIPTMPNPNEPNNSLLSSLGFQKYANVTQPLNFRGSRPSYNSIILPMRGSVVARPEEVKAGANYAGMRLVFENLATGFKVVTSQLWGPKA